MRLSLGQHHQQGDSGCPDASGFGPNGFGRSLADSGGSVDRVTILAENADVGRGGRDSPATSHRAGSRDARSALEHVVVGAFETAGRRTPLAVGDRASGCPGAFFGDRGEGVVAGRADSRGVAGHAVVNQVLALVIIQVVPLCAGETSGRRVVEQAVGNSVGWDGNAVSGGKVGVGASGASGGSRTGQTISIVSGSAVEALAHHRRSDQSDKQCDLHYNKS